MSTAKKQCIEPELFSVAPAADSLGIRESTIRSMLRRGELLQAQGDAR